MRTNCSGFTLIELMVVVIIIAALAGMVLPYVIPAKEEAMAKIAEADVANISTALKFFRLHNNRYPSTEEGLKILLKPSSSPTWKGAYLEKEPRDPWKKPYKYASPGTHNTAGYDIWSAGPDGQDNTDDDVGNWEK